MKKKIKFLLEYLIIFIIPIIYNLLNGNLMLDEIWNYGFAYNISTGLIPYKDFNMIVTPLYPYLVSIFLKLLGHNLIILHLFNSSIFLIIYHYLKKLLPKSYLFTFLLYLFFSQPNYSFLCLLFLIILIYLDNSNNEIKRKDYLIGFIIGLSFLTKQNIGIFLAIPTLFTKDIKVIFKRFISFLIPLFILIIILIINNSLYEFIDYCFLGLTSFANDNKTISKYIIFPIIGIIYSLYKYIKTKEIKYIYLLFFQFISYPIFDEYHTSIPFMIIIGDILNNLKYLRKNILNITTSILIIMFISFQITNIYKDEYTFSKDSNLFKYRIIEKDHLTYFNNLSNYLQDNYTDNYYFLMQNAYIHKLENNIPINKYDLLNNGNLGHKGINYIIKEIDNNCQNNTCYFLIDYNYLTHKTQYNQEILEHILINYNYKESIKNTQIKIYTN